MTQTIKYPAWWPKKSAYNDDPTGMSANPFENIRAMDNQHIVDFLTCRTLGVERDPVEEFDLLDTDASIKTNINGAMAIALQMVTVGFSADGITIGSIDLDAFKKFSWADIFELAFSDEEIDHYGGEEPVRQLYELMISTAERMRASIEAWSE